VEVTVTQSQTAAPFTVKVDVGIVGKAGDLPRVQTIALSARQGVFTFPLDTAPVAVTLDPNTTLLMEAGPFVKR
jgi:hypothetical protein